MTDSRASAVVIGGGILATSAAWHLVRRGVHTTLIADAELASGASGRSLAWLNSAGRRSRAYHELRMAGIDRYRTWAAHMPDAARYLRFGGGLRWATEGASLRQRYEHERSIGYETRWLTPDDVAAVEPAVDPEAVPPEGAIFNPAEAWVDLPSLIGQLATEITAAGGEIITNTGPVVPIVRGDTAIGAESASGVRRQADAVVLATGPAVPAQLRELGVSVPGASPAAMVVFTAPVDTRPVAVLNTPRAAIRPAIGGGLAIDSAWSEAELDVDELGNITVRDSTVDGLLAAASDVLAGHPRLRLDRIGVGYKPIPGDGEPVLGAVDDVRGLYVAFTHSGATLGLIAGELLADAMCGPSASDLLTAFSPARFNDG